MSKLWNSDDALGESLHFLRMSGAFYARSEFTAPWGLALPAMPGHVMFHVVTQGQCWLELEGEENLPLRPGDFTLVPHGQGHRLTSTPGASAIDLFDVHREQVSDLYEFIEHGGGGEPVSMICGAVQFDHPAAQRLIDLLPKAIHLESWREPQAEWMQSTLRLMADEARELRPAGEAVITRLADILVIQAIRAWVMSQPTGTGWLGALRDREVGRALAHIHRHPDRDWTVASLAREVSMSRSAFSARFTELVGEAPMAYLTRWRMELAVTWLRSAEVRLADLPRRLGYSSDAAFSRAFKRTIGVSPGAIVRVR